MLWQDTITCKQPLSTHGSSAQEAIERCSWCTDLLRDLDQLHLELIAQAGSSILGHAVQRINPRLHCSMAVKAAA